ncbi:phthiodiolone/phenolphthiodiolone dimycocerosates ketoreductase [Rhodococcus sp. PvR044]|jgi:phthiodiolone/phenolphthiodiolone dimycocerosates ketoreductase|uniref:LLM class flavin-dependent oxidoreductase n=1 Tax=Rhodococcus sp. PvR044 TaxID=3156402 RepID=UPI003391F3FA
MRTGVMESATIPRLAPDLFFRISKFIAAATGADSLWLPDHLNGLLPASMWEPKYTAAARLAPKVDAIYEPWTALGYLAARNRIPRLRLGVGVTDSGRRNPAVTAQAAATLHLLTRGRAILGIGPGEREGNEPYGVDWSKPVARFEEAMATIRTLWNSGGSAVSRESDFFPLRDATFDIPPHRGTRPEIWMGAHGPRMLRCAGRHADAWFPAFAQRPKDYGARLAAVCSAASDAGRDPDAITPAAWFPVCAGRNRDEVDEMLGTVGMKAFALCASAEVWSRHGAEHPLGADFSGMQDLLPQALDEATVMSYAERTPQSLLREVFLVGTPAEILDRLAEWRDHGMRYPVLANAASFVHLRLSNTLLSSVSFMRVLRGLKRL